MRILLVDDDEPLMELLASKLIEQNYAVDIATDGEMGWEFILLFNYDLVVLDWMLPDIDGVSLCQQIRKDSYKMPIMILSGRDRHDDKVRGLDAGADDYVVKPFDFEELTARIRALLRREINVASPTLQYGELNLDPKTHEVKYRQQLLPLTPKEYGLIELFLRHPQQVFSPGAIIDNLWAGEDPPGEEAVRTHIKGLRQKLKAAGMAKDTIQTVYGVGYRLKLLTQQDTPSIPTSTQQADRSEKIKRAWLTFKTVTEERLTVLNNFNTALTKNTVSAELHELAKNSAHKLAGSLGGFGFPEGSKIAKQVEILLDRHPLDARRFERLLDSLASEIQHQPFEENIKSEFGRNVSLLIIECHSQDNFNFSQQLAIAAQKWGMKTQAAFNIDGARILIQQKPPTVILLKIHFPDGEDLKFLEEIHQQMQLLTIVVIIEDAQFLDRLEVVRRGGNLVLQSPISPQETVKAIAELLQDLGSSAKVMIVDDDPQILLSLELSLQPWGFKIVTLSHPSQFWSVLEVTNPDILILDIEMPEINGLELCQVLRSDRRWQHLPVLFLTVHDDKKTEHQAFAIGADDYICKPVVGAELANRILNRLERSKISH